MEKNRRSNEIIHLEKIAEGNSTNYSCKKKGPSYSPRIGVSLDNCRTDFRLGIKQSIHSVESETAKHRHRFYHPFWAHSPCYFVVPLEITDHGIGRQELLS